MSKVLMFTIPGIILLFIFIPKSISKEENSDLKEVEKTVVDNDLNLCSNLFPNFVQYCNDQKNELLTRINVDTKEKIEFTFPVITYGQVILNKNWNFYIGIKRSSKNEFYLSCISKSGDKLNSNSIEIGLKDLNTNEYDANFVQCYIELLANPKFGLITSNSI